MFIGFPEHPLEYPVIQDKEKNRKDNQEQLAQVGAEGAVCVLENESGFHFQENAENQEKYEENIGCDPYRLQAEPGNHLVFHLFL